MPGAPPAFWIGDSENLQAGPGRVIGSWGLEAWGRAGRVRTRWAPDAGRLAATRWAACGQGISRLGKTQRVLFPNGRGSPPTSSTSSSSLTNDVAKQPVGRDLPAGRAGGPGAAGVQYTPHSQQFPRTRKMFDKGPDQVPSDRPLALLGSVGATHHAPRCEPQTLEPRTHGLPPPLPPAGALGLHQHHSCHGILSPVAFGSGRPVPAPPMQPSALGTRLLSPFVDG